MARSTEQYVYWEQNIEEYGSGRLVNQDVEAANYPVSVEILRLGDPSAVTDAKIWYHSCGACNTYFPDLLDNGIDILNPVQISAADMAPAELKAEFGDRLVFWGGGIDAQHVLPHADRATVRDHVWRNVQAFKPGGGYVFNNVHNIQAGVPPENIVAMYDAAYEYGGY